MIKTLVFDVGNIIWTFRPFYDDLFLSWSKLLNISPSDFYEEYKKVYQSFEISNASIVDWLCSLNPNIQAQEFVNILNRHTVNSTLFESHLNQDVISLIQKSRDSGLKVGCLSNIENYVQPLYETHIKPLFDYSIFSWQVGNRKPNLEIYQNIFKFGNWKPEEVVFVDDKEEYVLAAQELGINTILFKNFDQLNSDINQYLPLEITV